MTADDAVGALPPCFRGQSLFEATDEIDGVLDLVLRPGRQRPVGEAEEAAHHVDAPRQRERGDVGPVSEEGQPFGVPHHHVEDVAVDDQIAPAVGGDVHGRLAHLDAAEMRAVEFAQEFVVVARHIDDPGALAALAQKLLDHVVVGLRPEPAGFQPPPVDDVADEVDRVRLVMLEEFEQRLRLASLRAQMHVRDEEGAVAALCAVRLVLCRACHGTAFHHGCVTGR